MIKIAKPLDCKSLEITQVTQQHDLRAHPKLLKFGLKVYRLAAHYDAKKGDPLIVRPHGLGKNEEEEILYLYDHPPKKIEYIKTLRKSLAGETCPMCGGQDPGTLDHYLPKKKFPEHALLPYNLVPACSCNTKRTKAFADPIAGVRILHPYYDDCLNDFLYHVRFDPADVKPTFFIQPEIAPGHKDYGNLLFHLENVLKKTNFIDYFQKRWLKVKAAPGDMLPGEKFNRDNNLQFREFLTELAAARSRTEGRNSWDAVFFRSIALDVVADWLFANP